MFEKGKGGIFRVMAAVGLALIGWNSARAPALEKS